MFEKMKFILSDAWAFLKPVILVFISSIGPVLISAATKAVAAAASMPDGTTNEAKKEAAFTAVCAELLANGVSVGTSVVNAAIESAVVKLKSKNE